MSVLFSNLPGARERHLRRKYHNPLFGPAAAGVTDAQAAAARRQDQAELRQFQDQFLQLLREAAELSPAVDGDVVLQLKDRVDRCYEQCAGLPGNQHQTRQRLRRLAEVSMRAIWRGAGDDLQARAELEQEDAARSAHYALLEHPLVADLLRPDSPIGRDELVPTLLSEELPALRAALGLFDLEQRRQLCADARSLLSDLHAAGTQLPEAWQRLSELERSAEIQGPRGTPQHSH